MRRRHYLGTALCVFLTAVAVRAQEPVAHPILNPTAPRTAVGWRSGLGAFGESLAKAQLTSRGYDVQTIKLRANQGIDLVAIKRSATAQITDVKLVEVKTTYSTGDIKLSITKHGAQLSRSWLANRLLQLRSTGSSGRELAKQVYQFRKESGQGIASLGELHEINLRGQTYTTRDPVSAVVREQRTLRSVFSEVATGSSKDAAHWKTHEKYQQELKNARMQKWLANSSRTSLRTLALRSETSLLRVTVKGSSLFLRAAGPLGTIAATACDAYEIYTVTTSYRNGEIGRREYTIQVTRIVAGIAGASIGAAGGAYAGAALGSAFGPIGTTIGGVLGGVGGGISGYFAGSQISEVAITSWYKSMDDDLRVRIGQWIVLAPCP